MQGASRVPAAIVKIRPGLEADPSQPLCRPASAALFLPKH